jgi:hypothetical protein
MLSFTIPIYIHGSLYAEQIPTYLSVANSFSGTANESTEEKEDDGAQRRECDGAEVKGPGIDCAPAKASSNKSAEERADDPEDNGDNTSRRIPPRHQKLGQCSGDETQENPVKPERHQRPFGMCGLLPALWNAGATSCRHSINPKQDECSDYREEKTLPGESVDAQTHYCIAEKSADESADDSDDHRDDDSTWIVARHYCLGNRTSDQAKDDPC